MGAGGLSRKTGQGWPWVALFVIVQEASLGACKIVSFHIRAQGMRNALAGASLIAPPAPGGGLLLIMYELATLPPTRQGGWGDRNQMH